MAGNIETSTLRVLANRLGTVSEVTTFLDDFEAAYIAIYTFDTFWLSTNGKRLRRYKIEFLLEFGPVPYLGTPPSPLTKDDVLPEHHLILNRVRVESPGFWEFLGSLNPLQQIREYLNDRHRRKQDKEFRNVAEKDRLELENELLRRQITESDNSILRERISILRDLGFTDQEIRHLVWMNIGKSLAQLGRHQDAGLIEGAQ